MSGEELGRIMKRWDMLAVAGLALVVAGCSYNHPCVEVARNYQHNDIPVPNNFQYDTVKSWDYQKFPSGPCSFRSCEMVYWGDRPVGQLANWYEEQMPRHGWTKADKNLDQEGQNINLFFTKGVEEAEIQLERPVAADRSGYITKLTARIGVR